MAGFERTGHLRVEQAARKPAVDVDNTLLHSDAVMAARAEAPHKLTSQTARQIGFTGNQCTQCNSMRMRISGHCEVCEECGSSSGCS